MDIDRNYFLHAGYRGILRKYFFDENIERNLFFDPFARNLPFDYNNVYVKRVKVENNLALRTNLLVLGIKGSGKTRLFEEQLSKSMQFPPILRSGIRLGTTDVIDASPHFDLSLVTNHIFESYWDNFISVSHYPDKLRALHQDPSWLRRLHWFFARYPPSQPYVASKPQLMAWLHQPLDYPFYSEGISPSRELQELIRFVLAPTEEISVYQRVELLVDNFQRIPPAEGDEALHNLKTLFTLAPGRFLIKIFVGPSLQKEFPSFIKRLKENIRDEIVLTYTIPRWTDAEIVEMLAQRVINARRTEAVDNYQNWNWARERIGPFLTDNLCEDFIGEIVSGSLEGYKRDSSVDAPIHALDLIRYFLIKCAESPNRRLSREDLRALIQCYWEET